MGARRSETRYARSVDEPKIEEVWAAIDEAFARVNVRHPEELSCRSGCADCCGRVAFLTIQHFEAEVIRAWLATLSDEHRLALAALASREESTGCVMLDEDARCSIYPARPLVCRAFGLPYRVVPELSWPDEKRRLPVVGGLTDGEAQVVDTCFKNFNKVRPDTLDRDMVIDQPGLHAISQRLDAIARRGAAVPPDRVLLSAVVRRALGLPIPEDDQEPTNTSP